MRKVPLYFTNILFLIAVALGACQSLPAARSGISPQQPWLYTDLRALDAPDASLPQADLLAVYERKTSTRWQIRLDFLDLEAIPIFDMFLALDCAPGQMVPAPTRADPNTGWDALVSIPGAGSENTNNVKFLGMQVQRDAVLDTITIDLNRSALPQLSVGCKFQVVLLDPRTQEPLDLSPIVTTAGVPPRQLQILFAFWNSFPAYTPAQALRRWDGAHTGPLGGRHGLSNLLRAFRNRAIPFTLLDLKIPESLAALEYAGGIQPVRASVSAGLLTLPDVVSIYPSISPEVLPGWTHEQLAADSHGAGAAYQLTGRVYMTAVLSEALPEGYELIFTPSPGIDPFHLVELQRWKQSRVLAVPGYGAENPNPQQASDSGPTAELRRALAQAAVDTNQLQSGAGEHLLVLGGDLPGSTWAEPSSARATLGYLASRPWIRVVDAAHAAAGNPGGHAAAHTIPELDWEVHPIRQPQPTRISALAWQTYRSFLAPVSPASEGLETLRNQYHPLIDALVLAEQWESHCLDTTCAMPRVSCDGSFCWLASPRSFIVFDQSAGALLFAFYRETSGSIHQVLGTSAQFAVGLGSPSAWQLDQRLFSDPGVSLSGIPRSTGQVQQLSHTSINFEADQLQLEYFDPSCSARYKLGADRIVAAFDCKQPVSVRYTLAVDPWMRFTPGWKDRAIGQRSGEGFEWGWDNGLLVRVSTSGSLAASRFIDTRTQMGQLENPNADQPSGHFLTFPIAVVEIFADGYFEVELNITP